MEFFSVRTVIYCNVTIILIADTVERFHIIAHLFFVLAQNLLAANEPWLLAFVWVSVNALGRDFCEVLFGHFFSIGVQPEFLSNHE